MWLHATWDGLVWFHQAAHPQLNSVSHHTDERVQDRIRLLGNLERRHGADDLRVVCAVFFISGPSTSSGTGQGETMANLVNRALAWVGDIYERYGWQAAVITLVVVVLLIAGVASVFDLDLSALLGTQ